MKNKMEIKRISESDFLNLRESWNSLLLESNLGNIFLSWEWMYTWWKIFKRTSDELFILIATEDSQLKGIAPFYINKSFYNKISFLSSGVACPEYLTFIVAENNRSHFVNEVLGYLNNHSKWDLLYLESLDSDNEIVGFLESSVNAKKWKWITLKEHICFYLPLLSSLDEIKKTVSHSLIKNLRANKRKLSNKGLVEWKEITCVGQKDVYYGLDTVISLHQKRWQLLESKIGGVFSNKIFLEFFKKITEEFYKNDWLSISFLNLDGKPIAVDYNLKFDNKIWCYSTGFDPAYEHYSPGSICLWESLQFYINNGYREYDFLKGGEGYKNRWTEKFRKELDILVVKAGPKGALFLFWHKISIFTKKIIKQMLPNKLFYFLRALKFNRSR